MNAIKKHRTPLTYIRPIYSFGTSLEATMEKVPMNRIKTARPGHSYRNMQHSLNMDIFLICWAPSFLYLFLVLSSFF